MGFAKKKKLFSVLYKMATKRVITPIIIFFVLYEAVNKFYCLKKTT